ncbi:transcription factor IIIB 90 kDa subunit isoform X2 [Venturia canescens]|uniref:transcription factor IIIB 90 kDa subunit isoform X2 n=1 Tax=Venturia canescens TaxID=32260 RepID=UPI001C9D1480|nr:transcription factor IIIB 90 kDa subunit isoform X2 [Venturia canescens]
MSGSKCRNCGSTDIETDPARGDAVCTNCGFVLEDQLIVSETTFEETPSGNMMVLGQFVANDSTGGATGFGAAYHVNGKESREITIQNAKKGITHLCLQLHLNQHCIDTSVNFYKMALSRHLTRGRKQAHNHAACVYITCRTEGTAHMLIDISDVLQICVHELGRTYLRFTQALCINIPSMDPCLYIMRFANKLEFGEKTHEVSMTALRLVQRMKRDSIHSGRRPSGLCGAALLMAARLHEFSRSPADIIKIVKVHESTLRKRLIEFGDTPSSALTLEEFMTVDLEEEQDPPAFKAARKKDRERLQRLENIDTELSDLQSEIDKQLEDQKVAKVHRKLDERRVEDLETSQFIKESTLSVVDHCIESDPDDPTEASALRISSVISHPLMTGLGPDIASMGLSTQQKDRDNNSGEKTFSAFENATGEIDITDLDDEELDSYIMSEKEANSKHNLWNKINANYLQQQQEKEEKRKKGKEEGKPEKKKRRAAPKRNKNQSAASTAGEAIEKMLQEKRISSKINYEVLRSLNVGVSSNVSSFNEVSAHVESDSEPTKPERTRIQKSAKIKQEETPTKKMKINDNPPKATEPRALFGSPKHEPQVQDESYPSETPDAAMENDELADDEIELNPQEMTVGQMLGQNDEDDAYAYDYDEEEY